MDNLKLIVAYDGTDYFGFQEQRGTGKPTVQEALEKAVSRLAKEKVAVIGSGRTDSGVHAWGQVVNFRLEHWPVPLEKTPIALNTLLPPDIVIREVQKVPENFHARFSAHRKTYRYRIYNARIPNPFWMRYSYFVPQILNWPEMQKAADFLLGEHDFAAFRSLGTPVKSTVRRLDRLQVKKQENFIDLDICGNGFLYNMVRIIAGTLLNVGLGRLASSALPEILSRKQRSLAGTTLPPQGLCLMSVEY